jgi:hypothetical protein
MNPEIKAYFERFHGKEVTLNESGHFYQVQTDEGGAFIIAMKYVALKILAQRSPDKISEISHLQDEDWVYPFNGHLNDETKMLRLLNLRAFL